MRVNAIKCLKCGDIIYSRTRHDCRGCSCGSAFVDGGFDYLKVGGDFKNIKGMKIEVDFTKKELYDDWNLSTDKYGLIKETKNE